MTKLISKDTLEINRENDGIKYDAKRKNEKTSGTQIKPLLLFMNNLVINVFVYITVML